MERKIVENDGGVRVWRGSGMPLRGMGLEEQQIPQLRGLDIFVAFGAK